MSEELQMPPVVDLGLIMSPISEGSPSGEDLKYSGVYDEIREARRADEILAQGEWQTELKVADFQKALNIAVDALTTRTKDIQIAAWLCEALVKTHGFVGFRDGLKVLVGLQENFWDTMFPEIDEGDMESRANAIGWVDAQVALAIKTAPFTGAAGYSFNDFLDSQKFDIPENLDSLSGDEAQRARALKEQADRERRVTSDLWKKEIAQTRRAAMESVNFVIGECWDAIKQLDAVIEAKYDRNQAPGLAVLKKSLEDVHTQVKQILTLKREEEPDEVVEELGEMNGDGSAPAGGARQGDAGSGELRNRRDALKRLAEIADFFKRTEPHSPVSYLVQKAVKWGDMPLDSWLQEVVKDQGVLFQLRETLGVSPESQ